MTQASVLQAAGEAVEEEQQEEYDAGGGLVLKRKVAADVGTGAADKLEPDGAIQQVQDQLSTVRPHTILFIFSC